MWLNLLPDWHDRRRLFWRLQIVCWGATSVMSFGIMAYWPGLSVLPLAFLRSLIGIGLTSFVLRPILQSLRRHHKEGDGLKLVGVVCLCAFLGLADTFMVRLAARLMEVNLEQQGLQQFLFVSIALRSVLYAFWCILYLGIQYWIDTQERELQLAQAESEWRASELQLLRSQVNPHFLFNALNSILAASTDAASVQRITLALADYLRFSLRQPAEQEALGVELEALENYLQVEKSRFEDNFDYVISVSPSAREAVAPVAILQPLVENAIKYGQRSSIRPLQIQIDGEVREDQLYLQVRNSGSWIEPGVEDSTGIGLSNIRRRLELLYQGRASLRTSPGDEEVRVEVIIPLTTA